MYPSTTFIIEDRSQISDLQINEQYSAPLFAQFFSSDKGPEEMGEYYGEDFNRGIWNMVPNRSCICILYAGWICDG